MQIEIHLGSFTQGEVSMIRFFFNFVFFGVLFYAIWLFFPETFATLTGWAGKIYEVVVDTATALIDYVSELTKPSVPQPKVEQNGAILTWLQIGR